jgi:hypothetical protein
LKLPSLTILFFPEKDPLRANAAVTRARTLSASLGEVAVLPPGPQLAELFRDQLAAATAECVLLLETEATPDVGAIRTELAAMQQAKLPFSGPIFRRAWLRSALRAPLVDIDPIYGDVAHDWLLFNLAGSDIADTAVAPLLAALPPSRSARHTLALLALAHHLLCRCAILPETEPLRRAAALHALRAWRRHRQALPHGAVTALTTLLQQAPPLPLAWRAQIFFTLLTRRFSTDPADRNLHQFCAEIEVGRPGLFGGRALGEPVLQRAPR